MLHPLTKTTKAICISLFFLLSTVFWCLGLYFFTLVKILGQRTVVGNFGSVMAVKCAETWSEWNRHALLFVHKTKWHIEIKGNLQYQNSYLICANHQSWVDIISVQMALNARIPFLRFFLKKGLFYFPFMGLAWWALDYPFMKRHSKEYLRKHPEKRLEDMETTRRSCEKFRGKNISVMNFLEGTRFNEKKRAQQNSPYQHLLKPKVGGIAFVIEAMGDQFKSLLDVSICYPQGPVSFLDLIMGDIREVTIKVDEIPIPPQFLGRHYFTDEAYREELSQWLHQLWNHKDAYLEKCLSKPCQ